MKEEREGNVVASYKPDGTYGKGLDVYLDERGTFHVYLEIEGQPDEIDVTDDTLQGVREKTSKTLLQKRPTLSIEGTLIDETDGRTERAAFIGLHAGTGQPRFRLPTGKAVNFERYSSRDEGWDISNTMFVPDGVEEQMIGRIIAQCKHVGELETQLQESREKRADFVQGFAIDCNSIHTGYGRIKSTELAELEIDAAERIKKLSP